VTLSLDGDRRSVTAIPRAVRAVGVGASKPDLRFSSKAVDPIFAVKSRVEHRLGFNVGAEARFR
jgi:hypothetical protein